MADVAFVVLLGSVFAFLLRWAFRALPDERWQIIAATPSVKQESGAWTGRNFTYYGFFQAVAMVAGIGVMLLLAGAIGTPLAATAAIAIVMVAVCVPSSRLVALIVEKKSNTFTVGGASFVGTLWAPVCVLIVNFILGSQLGFSAPYIPLLAAMSIAYAMGEGLGRLSCISFGCCYGKPLEECPNWVRRIVGSRWFVFTGKTKKISYASDLDGKPVLPIQAITSTIYLLVALLGILLYLGSHFAVALVLSTTVTQLWRAWSETLRADYRGDSMISAYQIMAVVNVLVTLLFVIVLPSAADSKADLWAGLASLWNPYAILLLQGLGLVVFIYLGRSRVTEATLTFHVCRDRI